MVQDWTDDVYDKDAYSAHAIMSNVELMFATLKSTFSGTSAPSDMVAGMLWLDTTNHLLKIRNEANDAWLTLFDLANFGAFLDIISEKSSGVGVTIDGVLLKDSQVKTDTIIEKTGEAGVTIDGCLIKDGSAAQAATVDNNAINQAKMADSAIGQAELKSTTAEANVSVPASGNAVVTLPGGNYGLMGVHVKANDTRISFDNFFRDSLSASYQIVQAEFANSDSSNPHTGYVQQRYVQASGEIFWYMAMRDKATKEILRQFCAPDHPCMMQNIPPEDYPHPWMDEFDPELHEIIAINPDAVEQENIRKLRATGNRTILEVIEQDYVIDDAVEPDWSTEPITIGLPPEWEEKQIGEMITPIKKVIKKPKYIKTAKLKRKR